MAAIGLAEAARLTGRNPSTIHRAMKTGRLSYTKDPAGERRIEVAELERVFGIKTASFEAVPRGNGAMPGNDAYASGRNDMHGGELAALQRLLDDRECTIADLRESIRDLRARLDAESAERRREVEERRRLTMLLADQRPAAPPPAAELPHSAWRRFLAWRR
jgi:hypothetical protein